MRANYHNRHHGPKSRVGCAVSLTIIAITLLLVALTAKPYSDSGSLAVIPTTFTEAAR